LPGIEIASDLSKNLSSLFDQTNEPIDDAKSETISDPEEVIAFWEKEIKTVEKELPALFKTGELIELKDEEKTDDIDFIRYSAKYGIALRNLKDYKVTEGNPALLKYWLFAIRKYFWRSGNYVITLQYYRNNKELKETLFELYRFGKNYECYRYHLITCLTYNFTHNDKELRDFFKLLKDEPSDLVKYGIYSLIIKASIDQQLLSTLKANLSKEKNEYLKLIVLDYWKRDVNRIDSMQDLIKSVGL
jgi:hypothetical protein